MRKALPSNRVAQLAAFITGLGACATSLAGIWPNSGTTEIALIAGSVASISAPLSHVIGSWFWDRTPAGQAAALQSAGPLAQADDSSVTPDEWREQRYPVEQPQPAPQPGPVSSTTPPQPGAVTTTSPPA